MTDSLYMYSLYLTEDITLDADVLHYAKLAPIVPRANPRCSPLYEVTGQCHAYSSIQSRDLSTDIYHSTQPAPSDLVAR